MYNILIHKWIKKGVVLINRPSSQADNGYQISVAPHLRPLPGISMGYRLSGWRRTKLLLTKHKRDHKTL